MATPNPSVPALRSKAEFFLVGVRPISPPNDAECPICQEVLMEDVVQIVACRHTFHTNCVQAWLQGDDNMHRRCPYCRFELYAATAHLRRAPQAQVANIEARREESLRGTASPSSGKLKAAGEMIIAVVVLVAIIAFILAGFMACFWLNFNAIYALFLALK